MIQLALDALSHARPDRDAPRVHQAEARAESIGANSRASSEDVRAWAITVYIEVTGGSHSRKR